MVGDYLFSWLHLSDIHLGNGDEHCLSEQRIMLRLMREDIRLVLGEKSAPAKVDAIIVTGDVAYSGAANRETEYGEAREWLVDVASDLGLHPSSILTVPGNHDVQRSVDADRQVSRLISVLRSGAEPLDDALASADDLSMLCRRFANYQNFAASLASPDSRETDFDLGYWTKRFDTHPAPVRLIGMNTAVIAAGADDEGKLAVGAKQIESKLFQADPDREVVIVMGHHPFSWLRDGRTLQSHVQSRAHVYLSGHLHWAQSSQLVSGSGSQLVSVMAGATYEPDSVTADAIGYNLAGLYLADDGHVHLRVWPRYWTKEDNFRPNVQILPNNNRFQDFGLPFRCSDGNGRSPGRSRRPSPSPRSRTAMRRGARPGPFDDHTLFGQDGYPLAYRPLLNDWVRGKAGPVKIGQGKIRVSRVDGVFPIPSSFRKTKVQGTFRDDPRCRLVRCQRLGDGLDLTLQQTSYGDYLKTGEHLDEPVSPDSPDTYRKLFAKDIDAANDVIPRRLTNICGTGVFVIAEENVLLASWHSERSTVYPGRLSFAASGLMAWGAYPDPFIEAARKTHEEIQHQVNPDRLKLIGFGADTRKLYFQFGFVEWTDASADEVVKRYQRALRGASGTAKRYVPPGLIKIPLNLDSIIDALLPRDPRSHSVWEPAAEACLLTFCADHFGVRQTLDALNSRRGLWWKHALRDEWDLRTSSPGDIADMSVRYPRSGLADASRDYIDALMEFMGSDIAGKDVLEVGCGTGRLTQRLVGTVKKLTALDQCPRMIDRNKQRLGADCNKVVHHLGFMQEYERRHQVAICSQVLIHNVDDDGDFKDLMDKLAACARTVFVFEDVTEGRLTDVRATKLRSEDELRTAFSQRGMELVHRRPETYSLFKDHIAFMKFVRAH